MKKSDAKHISVYLLRHAPAAPRDGKKYPRDDRPLTKEGLRKLKKSALGLPKIMDAPQHIITSPLKRARDTARYAAKAFRPPPTVQSSPALLPEASTQDVLTLLRKLRNCRSVLLCGHEPQLSQVLSALLQAPHAKFELKKGGIARIDLDALPPVGPGKLLWLLPPKTLRLLAK